MEIAFSETNPSKKFSLAVTDYDQEIGAIFYQTFLVDPAFVTDSDLFFDITVNDSGGNKIECFDTKKA
jgi:hypothetical protein